MSKISAIRPKWVFEISEIVTISRKNVENFGQSGHSKFQKMSKISAIRPKLLFEISEIVKISGKNVENFGHLAKVVIWNFRNCQNFKNDQNFDIIWIEFN